MLSLRLAIVAVVALGLVEVRAASAAMIDGSLAISSRVTDPGIPLNSVTNYSITNLLANGGTGTFAQTDDHPAGVIANPTTITLNNSGIFDGSGAIPLILGIGSYGSFVSTQTIELSSSEQESEFYALGIFTATQLLGTFDPEFAAASVRLSFNRDGNSTSAAITLAVPPAPSVPEPTSLMLVGAGLLGLGAWRIRFARQGLDVVRTC